MRLRRAPVAAVVVRVAQAEQTCKKATVIWGLNDTQEPESEPISVLDNEDLVFGAHCSRAFIAGVFRRRPSAGDPVVPYQSAIPVGSFCCWQSTGRPRVSASSTRPKVQLEARRTPIYAVRWKSADLQTSLKTPENVSESLQRARCFAISDLAGLRPRYAGHVAWTSMPIVGTLMYAENFFIVLHNAERDTLRFLYYCDAEDSAPRDPLQEISMQVAEALAHLVSAARWQAADGQHRTVCAAQGLWPTWYLRSRQPRLAWRGRCCGMAKRMVRSWYRAISKMSDFPLTTRHSWSSSATKS